MVYIPHAGKRHLWIIAAMLLIFSGVARADSVQTIFAVENALYGQGYHIGHADGWMDNRLRAAIRKFQTAHKLPATGNLDAATLSDLGVPASGGVIKGNTVADRQAAIAELGLKRLSANTSPAVASTPEPKAAPAQKPELKTTPKPTPRTAGPVSKPAPRHVAKPEARSTAKKVARVKKVEPAKGQPEKVASNEAAKRVHKKAHKSVARSQHLRTVKSSPKPEHRTPVKPSPKPEKAAPEKPSTTRVAKAAPAVKALPARNSTQHQLKTSTSQSRATQPTASTQTASRPTTTLAAAQPATRSEPAGTNVQAASARPGKAATPKPETSQPKESRGFFGTLFHALFGWL